MASRQPAPGLVAQRRTDLDPAREKERQNREAVEDCEEEMRKYLEKSFGPLGVPIKKEN